MFIYLNPIYHLSIFRFLGQALETANIDWVCSKQWVNMSVVGLWISLLTEDIEPKAQVYLRLSVDLTLIVTQVRHPGQVDAEHPVICARGIKDIEPVEENSVIIQYGWN